MLDAFVFASALRGLDLDGGVAPVGEIVGSGAHVDLARFDGEEEGFAEEIAGNPGGAFVGPLVEVHVGVDAAGLFVFLAGEESG